MFGFAKSLKRKLKIKISLLKQRRRRNNLYPLVVPLHLSQIDLGEELTRVPSLTSLVSVEEQGEELTRVPSLISLQSLEDPPTEQTTSAGVDENIEVEEILQTLPSMQWASTDANRNVQLVELGLSPDSMINGRVMVSNLAFQKNIFVRWTADNWVTFHDQVANYEHSSTDFSRDSFVFSMESPSLIMNGVNGAYVELAVAYQVNGMEYWDNNNGQNFGLLLN